MRYNQLTYHKANPFYKQDYLPNRAWYNRKPKQYPSEIPTGQQYFDYVGRKHFNQHFNHSEIEQNSILKSPERYPFENRIALDKDYMRCLDTIDIQGAASSTRVNQSLKNKYRAQEELARRYNQQTDNSENKLRAYEQQKRSLAMRQYETVSLTKNKSHQSLESLENSRFKQNPERYPSHLDKRGIPAQYRQHVKQITSKPKPNHLLRSLENQQNNYTRLIKQQTKNKGQNKQASKQTEYSHIQAPVQSPKSDQSGNGNQISYNPYLSQSQQNKQEYHKQPKFQKINSTKLNQSRHQIYSTNQGHPQHEAITNPRSINQSNRFKSNPQYLNSYDIQLSKRRQEYLRTKQMQQFAKSKITNRQQFRKYNPTNLSLNLAAHSIVCNQH